ncbi:MAG: hypothetical protein IAE95_07655 [Chitinophagaceae bacterium]|nr:hypothetical protein [Chitinophagaceae bacterium]
MRKLALHIIIVFTAFNIVTLNNFSRLPVIFIHFAEHLEKNHSITLVGFLTMHYNGSDAVDSDDEKDKQLPFKSPASGHILSFTHPSPVAIEIPGHHFALPALRAEFVPAFVPKEVYTSLLRPPIA